MKRNRNFSLLLFVVFLGILFITFSVISVEARKYRVKKSKPHKHQNDRNGNGNRNSPGPAPAPLPHYPTRSTIFDVMSFGAKGDGVSDDSKVIIVQWQGTFACKCFGLVFL